jgi:hypothetical protein
MHTCLLRATGLSQKIALLQALRWGQRQSAGCCRTDQIPSVPKEKMTYWVTIKGNRLLHRRLIALRVTISVCFPAVQQLAKVFERNWLRHINVKPSQDALTLVPTTCKSCQRDYHGSPWWRRFAFVVTDSSGRFEAVHDWH